MKWLSRKTVRSTKRHSIPMDIKRKVFKRDNFQCQYCGKRASWQLSNGNGITQIFENEPTFLNRWTHFWRGWEDPIPFEIDHIVPICLGGKNNLKNLKLACRNCNRAKGHKVGSQSKWRKGSQIR